MTLAVPKFGTATTGTCVRVSRLVHQTWCTHIYYSALVFRPSSLDSRLEGRKESSRLFSISFSNPVAQWWAIQSFCYSHDHAALLEARPRGFEYA